MTPNDVDGAAIEAVLTRQSAAWDADNAGSFAVDAPGPQATYWRTSRIVIDRPEPGLL
jgi:hypothetical protein